MVDARTAVSRLRLPVLTLLGALLLVTGIVLVILQNLHPSPLPTLPVGKYVGIVFPDDPSGPSAGIPTLVSKLGFGLAVLGSLVLVAAIALHASHEAPRP